MKKFLSILVLFLAMFMFVACGEEEKEDNKTNEDDKQGEVEDEKDPGEGDKGVDFTVSQDVNKEVKLTEAGKKGVADLLTAFGAEEANQMVEQVVPMIEMARLSDEQVVEIAAIVTENMAVIEKLMVLMESSKDVTPDEDYYEKLPMSLEVLDAPQNEEDALPITAAEVGEDNIKTFSVAQTDTTATEELSYVISLDIAENTLTGVAEGYFKHSLSGESSKTENAGTLVSVDLSAVPAATTDLGTGSLKGYETHTYTYTIYLEEANKAQNEAQGAKFSGKIQVRLSDTQYGG